MFFSRAAFDFLREQRERKLKDEDRGEGGGGGDGAGGPPKITFKKPPGRITEASSVPPQPSAATASGVAFGGAARRVLPECVVGGGRGAPVAAKRSRLIRSVRKADDEEEEEDRDDGVDPAGDVGEGRSGETVRTSKKKSKAVPTLSFSFDDE